MPSVLSKLLFQIALNILKEVLELSIVFQILNGWKSSHPVDAVSLHNWLFLWIVWSKILAVST